jgi:hypothetical protein
MVTVQDRIWIPHQVGLEFSRNRLEVISQQEEAYDSVIKKLNEAMEKIQAPREHPFLSEGKKKKLEEVLKEVLEELEGRKKKHTALYNNDPILKKVFELFDGKVGAPFPQDRLAEIYKDGAKRYEQKSPPGYEDKNTKKEDERKYGDLIVWYQLIDKAKDGKPIIFVNDDGKEDWWLIHKGKTIGPRPELIAEMLDKAKAQFYMYQPWRFMEYAGKQLNREVTETAIEEAKAVDKARAAKPDFARMAIPYVDPAWELREIIQQVGSDNNDASVATRILTQAENLARLRQVINSAKWQGLHDKNLVKRAVTYLKYIIDNTVDAISFGNINLSPRRQHEVMLIIRGLRLLVMNQSSGDEPDPDFWATGWTMLKKLRKVLGGD